MLENLYDMVQKHPASELPQSQREIYFIEPGVNAHLLQKAAG